MQRWARRHAGSKRAVATVASCFAMAAAAMVLAGAAAPPPASPPLFRNPDLPAEQRIDNLLSLMTLDEKIDALSTNSGVPRLGVPNFGSSEGIHGVVQRGADKRHRDPIPTTQFPQPPGMGASWDPALVRLTVRGQSCGMRALTSSGVRNQAGPR